MKLHFKVRTKGIFKRLAKCALFCLVIIGLLASTKQVMATGNPPTPTIVSPKRTFDSQPFIRGVTQNNTRVAVWVDGAFFGNATVKNGPKGTASFAYKPFLQLRPGVHAIVTRAEMKNDPAASDKSKAFWLEVENPYPAPVLFIPPVVNDATNSEQPFITGVARNDSFIKIFIDKKLDGQFWVKNDPNGTAHFAYKPFLPLDPKTDHLVYATATDKKGKTSSFSNVVGFSVMEIKKSATAPSTSSEADSTDENTATPEKNEDNSEDTTSDQTDDANSSDTNENSSNSNDIKTDSAPSTNTNANQAQTRVENNNINASTDEDNEKDDDEKSNDNENNTNETVAGGTDDDDGSSNLILWLVVIAIVIIIIVTRLTSRSGDQIMGSTNTGQKKLFTEGENRANTLNNNVKTSTTETPGNKNEPPPPPPPASSF